MDTLISLQEAADMLHVNPMTLRRWDESGRLVAVRLGNRGDRKYRLSDIEELIKGKRQFASDTLKSFLDSGLMFYAYEEEKNFKYKFTLPENPLGYSPKVKAALGHIDEMSLSHYPHVTGQNLLSKISKTYGVAQENILVGAGALDLESLVFLTVVNNSDRIIIPEVSFPATEFIALLSEAEISFASMKPDLDVDFDAVEDLIDNKTRAIILSNPNNPTGKNLDRKKTLTLAEKYPQILFVIDEANIEYSDNSMLDDAKYHKNVVILRTFSKGYGLAGLRVGYLVGDKDLVYLLKRRQTPFTTNAVGLYAAGYALDDQEHVKKTREFVTTECQRIARVFIDKGFRVVTSDSNYLLVDVSPLYESSKKFIAVLNKHDISVVDGASFRGLEGAYVRICPRSREDNDYLISVIEKL